MKRMIEPLEIEDYNVPDCVTCVCSTEPVYVLDEDEHKSIALKNVGFCIGCTTLVVEVHKGRVAVVNEVLIRSPLD